MVAVQQYIVRPQTADSSDSFLSEVCKNDYQLTEEQVKNGESLQSAILRVSAVFPEYNENCFVEIVAC